MNDLNKVLSYLPSDVCDVLGKYQDIQEIRLRVDKPICVVKNSKNYKLSKTVTQNDINIIFENICENSVYAHQDEINQGFVTIKGGNRVGIAGTAVISNEKVVSIKNISSLNFRIAKEYIGCSDEILKCCFGNLIIAGPPNSGKTTILRDIARNLSSTKKVCVVDERFEICGVNNEFDVGNMTDCLKGYKKAYGMSVCLRTLSPQVIIFDEIGNLEECYSVFESLNSGVNVITSVHCSDIEQFVNRPICKKLIESNCFDYVVFLSEKAGKIDKIYKVEGNKICECSVF